MKYLLTVFGICLAFAAAFGQYQNTIVFRGKPFNLAQFYLRGNVKKITETNLNKEGAGYEASGITTRTFDEVGKVIEIVTVMQFMGQSMGTVTEKYSYDTKGMPVKIVMTMAGKGDEVINFFYDEKGRLVSMENVNGSETTKEKYEYDSQNRPVTIKNFRAGAKTHFTVYKYSYDSLGRITVVDYENMENKEKSRQSYMYKDKSTQPTSMLMEDGKKANAAAIQGKTFEYTQSGELVEVKPISSTGANTFTTTRNRYEYDSYGNWTKVTRTGMGEGYMSRKIEYYPLSQETKDIYKRSIIELSEPTLKSFAALIESAANKKLPVSALLEEENRMVNRANVNVQKLKKIPALEGNNAKQLTISMMEFILSTSTLIKLENLINQNGDVAGTYRVLAADLMRQRKEVMAEFAKLQ